MLELRNPRIAVPVVLFAGILWSFGPLVVRYMDNPHMVPWQYIFGRGSTSISYGITYDQSTNRVRAGVRGPTPFGGSGNTSSFGGYCSASGGYGANCRQQHAGGIGGNGSGGNLNVYGGGGNGHGSYHTYGNHSTGMSYMGGGQPSSHVQRNYAHRHQSHAAWGAGGNGAQHGNRGARGREGVVVVHEFYG